MRENRLHGSEGGEGESPFRPLCKGDLGGNRLQRCEELWVRPYGCWDGRVMGVGVSGFVCLGVSLSVHRVASISLPKADV